MRLINEMIKGYKLKKRLFSKCEESINEKINTLNGIIASIEESRNGETKSSAGDKFETSRAMMQIEIERNSNLLFLALEQKKTLSFTDLEKKSIRIIIGSLVSTNRGNYFISIGLGKMILDDTIYYCISNNSPLGKVLMGLEKGDKITFNDKIFNITSIY